METKKWYTSKSMWAAIVTAVVGAAQTIGLQFGFNLLENPIISMVLTVLGALGIYGTATRSTTLTK